MINKESALEVSAIENGTVIDHIPSQNLFNVIRILGLDKTNNQITLGANLKSKKIGKKGIIKVTDLIIEEEEYKNIIAFAPKAHISYIKDSKVVEKIFIEVPDEIRGNVKCGNPVCVTNLENLDTHFIVEDKSKMTLKCYYCEKTTLAKQFKVK